MLVKRGLIVEKATKYNMDDDYCVESEHYMQQKFLRNYVLQM